MKVAENAFYLEAVPANCIAMCAARNEHHIVSSCGHPSAEIASHGTRRHDRHPHVTPSASKTFVWGWTPDTSCYGCGPHGASVISFTSWLSTSGRNFEANPST